MPSISAAPWEGLVRAGKGGFEAVTGLDFSTRFFRLAARMQEEGYLRYALPEEGEVVSFHEIAWVNWGWMPSEIGSNSTRQTPATCRRSSAVTTWCWRRISSTVSTRHGSSSHDPRADEPRSAAGDYLALHLAGGVHQEGGVAWRVPGGGRAGLDPGRAEGCAVGPIPHAGGTAGCAVRHPRDAAKISAFDSGIDVWELEGGE